MDAELVIPTRGLVECSLVPVMEGFQEEEKVSDEHGFWSSLLNMLSLIMPCST